MSWANMLVGDFLRAAEELVPTILAARGAIERDRGLPFDLAHAVCEAGFFSLWLPKSMGGPELTPAGLARVVEVLSQADGSAGWLVGIGSSNSRLAGYLSESVAREIWGNGTSVLAGTLNPAGIAVAVPGGYRVNGQWSYASGINHSNWLLGPAAYWTAGSSGCGQTVGRKPGSCCSRKNMPRCLIHGTSLECAAAGATISA